MKLEPNFFEKLFAQIRNIIAILTKHIFGVKDYLEALPQVETTAAEAEEEE
jgi:hypothetical protein